MPINIPTSSTRVSYLSVEFTVIVLIYYNFLHFPTLSMIKVNVNILPWILMFSYAKGIGARKSSKVKRTPFRITMCTCVLSCGQILIISWNLCLLSVGEFDTCNAVSCVVHILLNSQSKSCRP